MQKMTGRTEMNFKKSHKKISVKIRFRTSILWCITLYLDLQKFSPISYLLHMQSRFQAYVVYLSWHSWCSAVWAFVHPVPQLHICLFCTAPAARQSHCPKAHSCAIYRCTSSGNVNMHLNFLLVKQKSPNDFFSTLKKKKKVIGEKDSLN